MSESEFAEFKNFSELKTINILSIQTNEWAKSRALIKPISKRCCQIIKLNFTQKLLCEGAAINRAMH
ncbi:MAG: hypothetical protein DRR16_07940 [Candidatus Parabeggiatoa sp. nov. 3]|nr:MAG: hypothetical protein DRR00_04255 [Gammaproteobacteria bacterium]RKZ69056.1 MAG: hypothetical protein DRQ99_02055 [Gammaproteobacteria bacterium]RKZ87152.1 MAG: hypothetical protein DRR16_07940 [Gammaproteobacteria bacterium]